jgi:hypothetical protein
MSSVFPLKEQQWKIFHGIRSAAMKKRSQSSGISRYVPLIASLITKLAPPCKGRCALVIGLLSAVGLSITQGGYLPLI